MKRQIWLAGALMTLLWATPARAATGVIVRTTNLPALQALCLLPTTCTVVGSLDGTLGQVFLVTSPLPLQNILVLLGGLTGFLDAEVDQVLNLVGPLLVPSPIPATPLQDRTTVVYPAGSGTLVWNSYANQQAATIVEIQKAQNAFHVMGAGIVADIDTGVDPTHPALQGVLLPGYDFTRNQPGASELNDLTPSDFNPYPPQPCPTCQPAKVNQSSAAILDQSSAAILDTKYQAFGHGTMVMGIIHLVAPTAQLLPLKAFKSDGTGALSDILRAIYYGVQNNANVINMSFDFKTLSPELTNALTYANKLGVVCAASAGNDGMQETVYPAALQTFVMGVASTTDQDARSSFSNYGNAIVWVAAPGEAIVSTYPFNTYAAGWGTSFSAPFVSGGGALLQQVKTPMNQAAAAPAVAHAKALDPNLGLGNGRLDLFPALQSEAGPGDYSVSATPTTQTITAGGTANYTVSATPANGFNQTVTWSCTGAPTAATCTVSPSSVTLDGLNAATATVTLATMASATPPLLVLPRSAPRMHLLVMLMMSIAWIVILLMFWNLSGAAHRRHSLASTAVVLTVLLYAYSCGGGYGNGNPPGPVTLSSVALNPSSVGGGSPSTGTVTLSGPAPSGGAVVNLSSNSASATVPATVTVAAGATSATFAVSTSAVTTSTPATITASYAGSTQTATLTVTPAGTPPGTYTLTITGNSGSVTHSTTVQVTVN